MTLKMQQKTFIIIMKKKNDCSTFTYREIEFNCYLTKMFERACTVQIEQKGWTVRGRNNFETDCFYGIDLLFRINGQ